MNMLQTKKEELKKQGKKGFTLMELLIVVAIIAVLVAIAIPLFTNQLEKSRDATSVANIRSAYAQAQAAFLTGDDDPANGVEFETTGTGDAATTNKNVIKVTNVSIPSQKSDSWSGEADGVKRGTVSFPEDKGIHKNDATITFTYKDGALSTVTIS